MIWCFRTCRLSWKIKGIDEIHIEESVDDGVYMQLSIFEGFDFAFSPFAVEVVCLLLLYQLIDNRLGIRQFGTTADGYREA